MTTLVTGASGFLGSHVTDILIERGERTRALVRPGTQLDRPASPYLEVRRGDMNDRGSLEAAVRGVDRIIHCAARTGPWGPEVAYRQTNVVGLQWLVEAALAAGVQRIVHVSSIIVHGSDVRGAADETAPLRSEPNPYSQSKINAERLIGELIRDQAAPVIIVRPGLVYGPRDGASFGRFAAMLERGRLVVIGSGHNHLPLIYVRDAAEGAVLASEADNGVGGAYLLVNDEPVTQSEYFGRIAAELGVAPAQIHVPYRLAVTLGALAETAGRLARRQQRPPVTRFGVQLVGGENRFSISRARQDLRFSPRVTMAEGVKRSVEWYRAARKPAPGRSAAYATPAHRR
jgi:nucleoside-diphosphate-sugar epimerase